MKLIHGVIMINTHTRAAHTTHTRPTRTHTHTIRANSNMSTNLESKDLAKTMEGVGLQCMYQYRKKETPGYAQTIEQ